MCIICNLPYDTARGMSAGETFLASFPSASRQMKKACDAMLEASKVAHTPEDRKKYNRTHKRMVSVMRDWNRIEHQREKQS